MKQETTTLSLKTTGPGLTDITAKVARAVADAGIQEGLATCFIRHTSASLVIQENADRDVLLDLEDFMRRVVSRDSLLYRHTTEGADDMPAHIRAALTATSLSIPVLNGKMTLRQWQALYLFEHRDTSHVREVVVHVMGT